MDLILIGLVALSSIIKRDTKYIGKIIGRATVTDGDGLKVLGVNIRIAGIDAPEYDQICVNNEKQIINHGVISFRELKNMINGKRVVIKVEKYGVYGRSISTVTYRGIDIGAYMVSKGFAVVYGDSRYLPEQKAAKRRKRGLWGMKYFIVPEDWRKDKMLQSAMLYDQLNVL